MDRFSFEPLPNGIRIDQVSNADTPQQIIWSIYLDEQEAMDAVRAITSAFGGDKTLGAICPPLMIEYTGSHDGGGCCPINIPVTLKATFTDSSGCQMHQHFSNGDDAKMAESDPCGFVPLQEYPSDKTIGESEEPIKEEPKEETWRDRSPLL